MFFNIIVYDFSPLNACKTCKNCSNFHKVIFFIEPWIRVGIIKHSEVVERMYGRRFPKFLIVVFIMPWQPHGAENLVALDTDQIYGTSRLEFSKWLNYLEIPNLPR